MTRTEMIQRQRAYRRFAMRVLAAIFAVTTLCWFCLIRVPLPSESIWLRSIYEIVCFFAGPMLFLFICIHALARRQRQLGLLCPQCRLLLYGSACGTHVLDTGRCPGCSVEIINDAT